MISKLKLIAFILCYIPIAYGQDSLQNYKGRILDIDNKGSSRLSIVISPYSVLRYDFVNYNNMNTWPGCSINCPDEKLGNLSHNSFNEFSVNYYYGISKKIGIETGLVYLAEKIPGGNYNFDTIRTNMVRTNAVGLLKYKFLEMPLGVEAVLKDKEKSRFRASASFGLRFSFIFSEYQLSGGEYLDSIDFWPGSNYKHDRYNLYTNVKDKYPRKNKFDFNRLTPYLSLNLAWLQRDTRQYYFVYRPTIIFPSIYQRHNTSEFYKNIAVYPLNIGFYFYLK